MVSRISDALMTELLADGRVLRIIDTLKGALSDEMMWLAELPLFVFDRLSELCPLSPVELRSKCMSAGQVNIAFVEDRIFSATQRLPFKLAIGTEADLAGNLERLKLEDEPDEQVTFQLWKLLHAGVPVRRLVEVLQLVQDLEWTTLTAEQQHAGAANLSRFHPDYGVNMLIGRAMIMCARRLLPSKTPTEKRIEKQYKALARLDKQRPDAISSMSLFTRDLVRIAKQSYGAERLNAGGLKKDVFRGASARFARQSMRVKRSYEAERDQVVTAKVAKLEEDKREVLSAIEINEQRIIEETEAGGAVRLHDCAWGPQEFDMFQLFWGSPDLTKAVIANRRANAAVAPAPFTEAELENLADNVVWEPAPAAIAPWFKRLAQAREYFDHCAIEVPSAGAAAEAKAYFLFVYGRQSPTRIYLSKLEPLVIEAQPPPLTDAGWAVQLGQEQARYRFQWHPLDTVEACSLGDNIDVSNVLVLTGLLHTDGCLVESADQFMPLQEYLNILPIAEARAAQKSGGSGSKAKSSAGHRDELMAQFPWLERFWNINKPGSGLGWEEPEGPSAGSSHSRGASATGEDLPDEEIDVLLDELYRYRAELASARLSSESANDFITTALGGAWTKEHKGVESYAVRGYARSQDAGQFCDDRDMFQSYRCEIELYTFEHAATFCTAWCHRMQHFFNLAVEASDFKCIFTREQVDAYQEPASFAASVRALAAKPHCVRRAVVIRKLFTD